MIYDMIYDCYYQYLLLNRSLYLYLVSRIMFLIISIYSILMHVCTVQTMSVAFEGMVEMGGAALETRRLTVRTSQYFSMQSNFFCWISCIKYLLKNFFYLSFIIYFIFWLMIISNYLLPRYLLIFFFIFLSFYQSDCI